MALAAMERTKLAETWFERLVVIMQSLADGDDAAVFVLYEEFGGQLRAAVRRQLRNLQVPAERELVDDLVVEAAFVVQDVAGAWRPDGGALPWVWAERRIARRVTVWIGQHTTDVDLDGMGLRDESLAVSAADPDEADTLSELAVVHPQVALLEQAMTEALSVRERTILLAYEACRADGDPSPANTLSRQLGLTAANVRQITKRAKDKVRALVTIDERFASIRGLHILR